MKALSIRQPWASLIVHGIKDIENRTWACPKKYIGQRVLIHASMKSANHWDYPVAGRVDEFLRMISKSGTDWSKYPFGSIIGSIEIVDCVINHPSVWAEKSKGYSNNHSIWPNGLPSNCGSKGAIYNWVLANPVLFENPIPAKGKLSFWESGLSEEELIEHFKTKEQFI